MRVEDEKIELACEITETKLVEEVVDDLLFNSKEVKTWIERFVPPPHEVCMNSTSKRMPLIDGQGHRFKEVETYDDREDSNSEEDEEYTNLRGKLEKKRRKSPIKKKNISDSHTPNVGSELSPDDLDPTARTLLLALQEAQKKLKNHQDGGSKSNNSELDEHGQVKDVVKVIRSELRGKQHLIDQLVKDINRRDESILVCGLDIRKLREENLLLRVSVQYVSGLAN